MTAFHFWDNHHRISVSARADTQEEAHKRAQAKLTRWFSSPVDWPLALIDLPLLSSGTRSALAAAGICTMHQLRKRNAQELSLVPHVGAKRVDEIMRALEKEKA